MEELRSFASTSDFRQCQVMSKLRDPLRFAAFVEGASHLGDEESLRFEARNVEEGSADNAESN